MVKCGYCGQDVPAERGEPVHYHSSQCIIPGPAAEVAERLAEEKARREALDAEEAGLKAAYDAVSQPFEERMERLREEWNEATAEAGRVVERVKQEKQKQWDLLHRLERSAKTTQWREHTPRTPQEFCEWVKWRAAEVYGPGTKPSFGVSPLSRPPKVEGLTVFAATDGFDRPNDKWYAAFDADGGMVGWMHVNPSQHPGDESHAGARVDGADIFGRDDSEPVKRWVAALEKRTRGTGRRTPPKEAA